MPLFKGKSKKAFEHNVKAEMEAGKPQKQSLAIAYSVKRKPKKMAKGGDVKEERKRMASKANHERFNKHLVDKGSYITNEDPHRLHHYGINQQASNRPAGVSAKGVKIREPADYMTDVKDDAKDTLDSLRKAPSGMLKGLAEGGNVKKRQEHLKHPRMVESSIIKPKRSEFALGGAVEGEEHSEHDEMFHDNEHSQPDDMNPAHGMHSMDDSEDQPMHEEHEEHANSIAAAIMSKRDRMHEAIDSGARDLDEAVKMAEGGEVDDLPDVGGVSNALDPKARAQQQSNQAEQREKQRQEASNGTYKGYAKGGQVDLSMNADEEPNHEDQMSFEALKKENYSESAGLDQLDQPMDSNEHGDMKEEDSEDKHDKISAMSKKIAMRRQFKVK